MRDGQGRELRRGIQDIAAWVHIYHTSIRVLTSAGHASASHAGSTGGLESRTVGNLLKPSAYQGRGRLSCDGLVNILGTRRNNGRSR